MEGAEVSSRANLCQICNSIPPNYTCPRCSIPYCSMNCYKSTAHLNCSEEFYKECVETELKSQTNDPEQRRKMTEILKRIHEQNTNPSFDESDEDIDGLCEELDSDDDEDVPDLAERIENIDLDDANELWGVLTDAERQEFEALLRNGDEEKVLPHWTPWWSPKSHKKQLVEEIDETEKIKRVERYPKVLEIPYISAVEKASPKLPFNLLNVLYSYVLMTLHYDGDHQNSASEAVSMFLQLCDNIGDNKLFDDEESAVNAVTEKAADHQLLNDNAEEDTIEYIKQIIQGPSNDHQSFYMSAAISDLHQLFTQAKKELSKRKDKCPNTIFPKKFTANIDEQYFNLSKKNMPLYLKKLEYYISWIHKYGKEMVNLKMLL